MAQKWNLQDIRPAGSKKPSRRQVPLQKPHQDIEARPSKPQTESFERDPDLESITIIDGGSKKRKRIIISVVVAIVILVAGFFVNTLLSGAEVTAHPKFKDTTVQATFTAHAEPQVGELGYELLVLEANGERQVSATGQEEASERAEGNILIYNAYSSSPQRLIKNTRFESPEGLIYRISESVEVPGKSEDAKGNTIPGVITAKVFADGTGEQYNIDSARFSIPGLLGSDQYDTMYAESTDGFTGGFEGTRYIIEENELQTAKQALHLELRDALLTRLKEENYDGFTLYDGAITFTYETLPATEYGDDLATIKERAKLQVPMFKDSEFAEYLARGTIAGYEGDPVTVEDPLTLTFSYPKKASSSVELSKQGSFEFNLSGSTRIIWKFDASKLQSDLAGLSKTALSSVLSGYPAIERAEATVRPFWSQSFPEDPNEITITTVLGDS